MSPLASLTDRQELFVVTEERDAIAMQVIDEKLIYGGVEVYSAMELKKWLYADIQANIGLARYYDQAAVSKQGYSLQAGPGLQFRPFVGSE